MNSNLSFPSSFTPFQEGTIKLGSLSVRFDVPKGVDPIIAIEETSRLLKAWREGHYTEIKSDADFHPPKD